MKQEISKTIFFWTLVVLFFITSSLVIFYAYGYRFNTARGVFIYGGSITLKTNPQDVVVKVNNVEIPSKKLNRLNNSYHIDGIKPGNYIVEVSAPGYQPWSKRIDIHSGVSTEFWNVLLSKNEYERTSYDSEGIGRFFISPRKNVMAFTQDVNGEFLVKILSPTDNKIDTIFSSMEAKFTTDEKENIEWSPQAHRVIIPAIHEGEEYYYIVTVDTKETINLKDIAGTERINHVRWDPSTRNVVFYMSENNLYRVDLDSPSEIKQIATNIASYELSADGLFYFQLPQGLVYQTNYKGTDTPLQITASAPSDMNDTSYELIVYDEKRLTLRNKSGRLYVMNVGEHGEHFNDLGTGNLGSQFSDDGKKLLFWTNNEISTYFLRDWEVQPTRIENETLAITRFSQPISDVQWMSDYEHVMFTVNGTIQYTEIDHRDRRDYDTLTKVAHDKSRSIVYMPENKIYFIDKNSNGKDVLYAITFPEKTPFLGFIGQ